MIKFMIVKANDEINIRGHVFYKNLGYFCRQSKDGSQILVQDDRGRWVMFTNKKYATFWSMLRFFKESFTVVETNYVRNYKEMKKFVGDLG
jgi:hypothetical protein